MKIVALFKKFSATNGPKHNEFHQFLNLIAEFASYSNLILEMFNEQFFCIAGVGFFSSQF